MKRIVILGSTGSIGQSALEVVRSFPDRFRVMGLACGSNVDRIKQQIQEYKPRWVSITDSHKVSELNGGIPGDVEVLVGKDGMIHMVQQPEVDLVIFATAGTWGLSPLLAAIESGKQIALANKESLVMAGRVVTQAAEHYGVRILPIDSEHNAIFQILEGHPAAETHKIYLTCSGGPLLHVPKEQLTQVTPEQALRHPRWKMGKKITIDSSTLMNKGLEIIEAKWLFGLSPDKIQVLIHPEAVIHSMVEFVDGSLMAQMGVTDMKGPIQYVLSYPQRLAATYPRLDLVALKQATFAAPDWERFPCLGLAYRVAQSGDSDSTTLNAANDVAVEAFLQTKIRWSDIPHLIETVLSHHPRLESPTLEDILDLDQWAREESYRWLS